MAANEITVLVGLGCSLIGAAVGVAGHKQSATRENIADGENKGILLTEIGYIKSGVDDIKRKQDGQEDKHNALAERVTRVEESAKQAHHRIDRCVSKEGD